MKLSGQGLVCPRCGRPYAIFYARDFRKMYGIAPGLRDRDWVVVKVKCIKHGSTKLKLNAFNKEAWVDEFKDGIYRCMKCEQLGTIENVQEKGQWQLFRIHCPVHGLTDLKRIVSSLFFLVTQLQEQSVSYVKYMEEQPSTTFSLCSKCGHIVEPGTKFCDKCGTALLAT